MRILSAIQPTNLLHIGNLFGALLPAVELQKEHRLLMMIANYHAITVTHDPKQLHENTLFLASAMLAAGIDPANSLLFKQSDVSAHTELAWILQTQTHLGEAERMTQFKDKADKNRDGASVGLFTYPTLMAADILLYKTEAVPVGEDQKQHLELTRDLAQRLNKRFDTHFIAPEPMIRTHGARIRSLTEPEKKMSKSAPNAKSYISIMDSEDLLIKKIRSAVTDSLPGITVDDSRLGLKNLLTIYSLVTKESMVEIAQNYDGKGMGKLKDDLAQALNLYLSPLQAEILGWMENKEELAKILKIGATGANEIAQISLKETKIALGI